MDKNPSKAQIRANRQNAKKSTGPRTIEGKMRSAQNAQKSTGPKTAKGKARSVFNAVKNGLWRETSELRVCIGCLKKCNFAWPPQECLKRGRLEGKLDNL